MVYQIHAVRAWAPAACGAGCLAGATHPSLFGLVLMMVGMVPAVTGFAGICLLEEVMKGLRARRLPAGRPSERRA